MNSVFFVSGRVMQRYNGYYYNVDEALANFPIVIETVEESVNLYLKDEEVKRVWVNEKPFEPALARDEIRIKTDDLCNLIYSTLKDGFDTWKQLGQNERGLAKFLYSILEAEIGELEYKQHEAVDIEEK